MPFRFDTLTLGHGKAESDFLAGLFYFGDPRKNPLLVALPRALFIPAGARSLRAGTAALLAVIEAELEVGRPGCAALISKAADMLFSQAVRSFLDEQQARSGWLDGVGDPYIGRAFSAMHVSPERRWTLQLLAKEAGCSRAVFAERFRRLVGTGALSYLTQWRMHLASGLLLERGLSISDIADRVGYSPDAFSKTFRRWSGITPTEFRTRGIDQESAFASAVASPG